MRISTGSSVLDWLLEGGLENDTLTTVFGPAGSGKSNLSMVAAVAVARTKQRVIFIDTEGSFSVERFKQVALEDPEIIDNFMFMRPTNFEEQRRAIARLQDTDFDNVGLIVVDSIAMLYRLEMGKVAEVHDVNKELGMQVGILTQIARKNKIPVLITNQVYSSFEEKDKVHMVGGDILKYGSKTLIEFQRLNNKRVAVLRKHRSIPEGKQAFFTITNAGIMPIGTEEKATEDILSIDVN